MKEIDFLPQWYMQQRRRNSHYRTQYISIGCVLLLMLGWSLTACRTVATARKHLKELELVMNVPQGDDEYSLMRERFGELTAQDNILSRIDSRIEAADILGEISFLAGEQIKLSRLSMQAENFPAAGRVAAVPAGTVRAVRDALTERTGPYEGDIRFKITISGIASDSTRVAQLVNRLEQSSYFSNVVPVYSRNGKIRDSVVSEFEITCYLANYVENRMAADAAARGPGGAM